MNIDIPNMLGVGRYLHSTGINPAHPTISNISKAIGGIRSCPKMYVYTDRLDGIISDVIQYRIADIGAFETHILSIKESIKVFDNEEAAKTILPILGIPYIYIEILNICDGDNIIECHIREIGFSNSGKRIPISYTNVTWLNQKLDD